RRRLRRRRSGNQREDRGLDRFGRRVRGRARRCERRRARGVARRRRVRRGATRCAGRSGRDLARDLRARRGSAARPDDGRDRRCAAGRHARGDHRRDRARGTGDRRGDSRRLAGEDAPRSAVARRRRDDRHDARRQPSRFDRRLPRRLRGAATRARARVEAPDRRGDRAPTDMSTASVAMPRRFASLVKIEHTLFALPFAYVGAILCIHAVPSAHDLVWITLAMVGARSLAMGLNRLIDAQIDARNPRTASRELPSGLLTPAQVALFCLAAFALFLVAVFQLSHVVRYLWPIPIVGFVIYPYLKRFTWLSHLWLGAVDGLAPVG